MASLEKYLLDEYPFNKRDIDDIEKLLATAIKPYESEFHEEFAWPYKIVKGKNTEIDKLSNSTTAMILNALLRLGNYFKPTSNDEFGNISKLSVFPIKLGNDSKNSILDLVKKASTLLTNDVLKRGTDGNLHVKTTSTTFGDDDIFTFAWLAEVSQADWGKIDHNIEEWKTIGTNICSTAKKILDDCCNKFEFPPEKLFNPKDSTPLEHAFPALRLIQIIRQINGKEDGALSDYCAYFEKILHDQLSFSSIPDSRFDPAELMFCLEGMLLCQKNVVDRTLFDRVFDVLKTVQHTNAYWRPVKPYLATPQGLVLFPVSVEVANSMLRACAIFDGNQLHDTYGSKCIDLLRRYWQWLRARAVRFPKDGNDDLLGWHSEHVNEPSVIHLWETSQVMEFLLAYRNALHLHIARTTLVLSRFAFDPPETIKAWSDVGTELGIESKCEPVSSLGESLRVYKDIGNNFIGPHLTGSKEKYYSMLLYGPPGTGKSTIAENISAALGWRLIKITVSDFLEGGGAQVEARAKNIFEVLMSQTQCVVLFDEIDHLLLDRDSEYYREQDTVFQFMTPGMLTKLNDLRKRKNTIFIIATNYEDRIDPAIKRIGRIDKKYLVLPPDKAKRIQLLKDFTDDVAFTTTPDHDDWNSLADSSLLLGYTDIKQTVETWRNGIEKSVSTLIDEFEARARTISLEMYSCRFNVKIEAVQSPLCEFLALVALRLEVEKELSGQEKRAIESASKIIKNATGDVPIDVEIIKKYGSVLDDNSIVKVLAVINQPFQGE
ncbi:MAG: AAA family ATPase [Desulfuromonadaceae bacterium]